FSIQAPGRPVGGYFSQYTDCADHNNAVKYILWKFAEANRARLIFSVRSVSLWFILSMHAVM
ncbi:hypothetical protein BS47DRAFT_1287737, partial [Hydnum rufescens UP504]